MGDKKQSMKRFMYLVDMFKNGELYRISIYGESRDTIQQYLYDISPEVIFVREDEETERQQKKRTNGNFRKIYHNGKYIGIIVQCDFRTDRCQSIGERSKKIIGVDSRYRVVE